MVFIVAALAAASVFFLFVIRSYRLMNIRLKRANEYTQNVVENMAEGLITVNSLGDIISYNNKGLDLLGLDSSSNIVSDSGWFEGRVEKTINSGESVQGYEFVYPGEEGEVNILADVTPLREPGSSNYGAVIIIRDMTRIKRLEREIARNEKLAATGRLAAMVAHEIRNPLSSIKGFGMFFASLFSDDEQKKEYAMLIASEVDRINIVVTDLLTYSRKMDIKPEFTDIEFLFDETLGLLQFEIEKKKIKVSKNISKSMPRIKLDKERMKQVFLNLMINAVEMMDENGEIEVGADLHKNRDKSVIWISDTGPGIEMEKQKEIFDLFFTTRKKGTGLGLAIVQKIIEYHDGSIEVESPVKNGRGTMFKINLPVHPD
jgi:two-component system sensor histidine kinase HydH